MRLAPRLSNSSPLGRMALVVGVVLLPVALLAVISITTASRQVKKVVHTQVRTTAEVSSLVVGQQMTSLGALVHSFATRPSLAAAVDVKGSDPALIESALASLAGAVPGISASFVAGLDGTSLDTYPVFPDAIGTNFAYREWYTGLVASGRPYVSSAIETKEADHTRAVTVTDYITGADGRRVGILGINYRLTSLRSFATSIGQAQGITLSVTDRVGTSLTAGSEQGLVSLAGDPRVRAALAGRSGLLTYAPVLRDGSRGPAELSAYAPVAGTGWTVVASIREGVAFAGLGRLRETVLVSAALLASILLAAAWLLARSDRRGRELLLANRRALADKAAGHHVLVGRERELSVALDRLEVSNRERERLLGRTVEIAERERIAVAADLHDGPIQQLTVVAFTLDYLAQRVAAGNFAGLAGELAGVRENVSGQMSSLRRMMVELRPPILDVGGVGAAVDDLAEITLGGSPVRRDVQNMVGDARFAPEVESVVYRVTREALMNVKKHADATRVELTLERRGDTLCLSVSDNGVGFDQANLHHDDDDPHLGLLGVEERVASVGGVWSLQSAPGKGTRCEASIPLKPWTPDVRVDGYDRVAA